jgi:serine protease inhibitor
LQGSLLNPHPQVNLPMYHPFFYPICDNQAGERLFVGVPMNSNAG